MNELRLQVSWKFKTPQQTGTLRAVIFAVFAFFKSDGGAKFRPETNSS